MTESPRRPVVRHRPDTEAIACPYGQVQRIVTGGEGGIANVHVIRVSKGTSHFHRAYDEVYYVLAGAGTLTVDGRSHAIAPGSVAVIPAGLVHAIDAAPDQPLEFIIFGTPAMSIDDDRARPSKPPTGHHR